MPASQPQPPSHAHSRSYAPDAVGDPDSQPTPPSDPLALESQVCFALSLASRSVINAYRPVLAPLNLTHPQYLVMLALWEHRQLRQKDLAELLGMDPGTLSPLVRRLEHIGYVRRTRDPQDERSVLLDLTEDGAALRERARAVPQTMMRRLGLDLEEVHALHRSMGRLIAAARGGGEAVDPRLLPDVDDR